MQNSTLDILFLIDATGSMVNVINGVKTHIKELVEKLMKENSTVRLGIVAYRDYLDKPEYETFTFSTDVQKFRTFLKNLEAKGGDDDAEDVFTGLEQSAKMNWLSEARMIVHFADAPCHGLEFHDKNVHDYHEQGDKHNRNLVTLLNNIQETCKVNTYQFMHLNSTTKLMIEKFKEKYPKVDWYIEDELDNIENMNNYLYKSSIASISKSFRV